MNKIIKRATAIVTALAIMAAAVVFDVPERIMALAAASTTSGSCGAEGDNVTWSYDADTGVLTISGEGAMEDFECDDLEPPADTPWAQLMGNNLKLVVEDGVTHIGNCAFMCSNYTKMDITLPDSVKSIGDFAFYMNTLPKLPKGLQTIGDFAFCLSDGESEEITLPPSVTSIGELAILPINKVKKIYYYEGVKLETCDPPRIIQGMLRPPNTLAETVYYFLNDDYEDLDITKNDNTFTVCKRAFITVEQPLPMPVFINETTFPDENFRSYLSSATVDKNQDGALSDVEIANVTSISVAYRNIADLTGIALFTKLKTLTCNSNKLTSLDVSENRELTSLNCSNNQLTSLDVSENYSLTSLTCSNNQLTSLDVSKNMGLTSLTCSNNQLTSLDLSRNSFARLTCTGNMYTVSGCIVDPAALPTGFDLSKASGWTNCKLTDDNKILYLGTGSATYTYDCGNGQTAEFTLGFQPHNCTKVDKIPATETTTGTNEHWHCSGCGKDFADENGETEMTENDLTIPVISHTHDLTHVPEVPATETTTGTNEHWHCSDCGKDFTDENGETEMTETDLTIPVTGHMHTLTHVPATETTKEHWHCAGCNKDFSDENGEHVATADDLKIIGMIENEVQSGDNAPSATLTTPADELIDAVLTDEEKAVVNDGKDIKIILTIDVQDNVATEDKTAVETAIGGLKNYKLGQYLDVNLFKVIDGVQNPVTETKSVLTITFEIPAALRGSGRTYSVIRVHNGETTVLPDLDNDDNTVTIETDKFSTYVLAYSEKSNGTPPTESGSNSNDSSNASEPTNSEVTPPESSGSSNSDTTSPSGETSSPNESVSNSDDSTASSDENNSAPSESASADNSGNPSTGIAISLVPLAAAATALMVTVKRKKK